MTQVQDGYAMHACANAQIDANASSGGAACVFVHVGADHVGVVAAGMLVDLFAASAASCRARHHDHVLSPPQQATRAELHDSRVSTSMIMNIPRTHIKTCHR